MKEDWKWIFASEIVFMVRHNERICRSFCVFTLLLIKFLMHVSRDLHRNAEPDLLMFRDSMHLVLQNAWNRGSIKEYDRKYHRLETSEKLSVIFNVCESIAWHVKWSPDAERWLKASDAPRLAPKGQFVLIPLFYCASLQHWTQQHKHTFEFSPTSPHWMYWRWRHGVSSPCQQH